jgi:predicted transcriptional regulator
LKKYRTRFDIMADILTSAMKGRVRFGELFYSSSASYSRVRTLTTLMKASGLLQESDGTFSTTIRGQRFLSLYAELSSLAGQPVLKRSVNGRILTEAKEWVYRLKQMDKNMGTLLLQGRSRTVLDAAAYYIVSKRSGQEVTLYDVSRLFQVSVNAISQARKTIENLDSQLRSEQKLFPSKA